MFISKYRCLIVTVWCLHSCFWCLIVTVWCLQLYVLMFDLCIFIYTAWTYERALTRLTSMCMSVFWYMYGSAQRYNNFQHSIYECRVNVLTYVSRCGNWKLSVIFEANLHFTFSRSVFNINFVIGLSVRINETVQVYLCCVICCEFLLFLYSNCRCDPVRLYNRWPSEAHMTLTLTLTVTLILHRVKQDLKFTSIWGIWSPNKNLAE